MTDGLKKIVEYVFRALFGLLGGLAGYQGTPYIRRILPDGFGFGILAAVISVFICGFIGVLIAPLFVQILHYLGQLIERQLKQTSWSEISSALTGLIVGLVLANLFMLPFSDMPFGPYLAVILNLLIGFVMAWIFESRQEEIRGAVASVRGKLAQRLARKNEKKAENAPERADDPIAAEPGPCAVLDASVIIDGRILDIAKTGFLRGTLILPSFVLHELQNVADSKDQTRRTRGRFGLDAVKGLQKIPTLKLRLVESSLKEYNTEFVDSAVVAMAQKYGCDVLTTDYNLNKVAQIQNVRVLNVNDLANAIKPTLLPGDEVTVDVIKEGKDARQGIGYLENGTMLVVEDGGPYIGKRVTVTLSSMLQTSAGRMFFGRVKSVQPGSAK